MRIAFPLAFLSLCVACGPAVAAEAKKPNIIFVLADDLGIDGVSCYGADAHKTPHLDALAESGIRFTTCYAAPLCGPSRCALQTGRYAFRTGGLTLQSWRPGGPGPKGADEQPIAALLKKAGYATGQAGKWRQLGESPGEWGYDEYLTDNSGGGYYWETNFIKNGETLKLPAGTYAPDVAQDFTLDFIRRHKDQPFFFYYAPHLVHKPTLRTPDTKPGTKNIDKLYDDNIRYVDKQVGELVDELQRLGLRENTLVFFSGDNGTAAGYPSPVHGRMLNGWKGSMLEGGSRVPLIASWPAVTPQGKVIDDLVSFADVQPTLTEIVGVKPSDGFEIDGRSFLPQLRGKPGTPRAWAYVQLGAHWYVRESGFKLNEAGNLFDMSDAPFVETPIAPENDTDKSKAARQRLTAVLEQLNPAAGKTDHDGDGPRNRRAARGGVAPVGSASAVGPWKSGDSLTSEEAPAIGQKELEISADIKVNGTEGVIVSQGGGARGYAVYLTQGKLAFAVRQGGQLTTIVAKDALGKGRFHVQATLHADGALALLVDGNQVAEGKTNGLIIEQPRAGLSVGDSGPVAVGDYDTPNVFKGKITNVRVKASGGKGG